MEAKIQAFTDRLRDLLLYKNQNYGNSASSPPFLVPELTPRKAILVRISDKINRLQTLAGGEPDKVGESFDDTLFDLAGYIVLYFCAEK